MSTVDPPMVPIKYASYVVCEYVKLYKGFPTRVTTNAGEAVPDTNCSSQKMSTSLW